MKMKIFAALLLVQQATAVTFELAGAGNKCLHEDVHKVSRKAKVACAPRAVHT